MRHNSWLKRNGKWYFLASDGKMVTGWLDLGWAKYFLNDSGAMLTSWQYLGSPDQSGMAWYWFENSGEMRANSWLKRNGKWYFLARDGKMVTGWLDMGWTKYFLDGSGAMLTSWQYLGRPDGTGLSWYWFDTGGAMHTGWERINGKWYYLDPAAGGAMATGWTTVNGVRYYLTDSGAMATSWQYLGGAWRYFSSGGILLTGWQQDKGKWYYLDPNNDGAMLTGWQTINGAQYYMNDSGAMLTGWQYLGNAWRYFSGSGPLLTGWQTIGGESYYLDPDNSGAMFTGWHTIGGTEYYFHSSGYLATRPTYINGEMYMFGSDGRLQKGGSVSLGGQNYTVSDSGVIQGYVTAAGRKAASVLDRIGWNLRAAYNWAAGLTYANRWYRANDVETYANYGFNNGYGNCFVMNACLYQMAKMLGYDVWMTNGGVRNSGGYVAPHGWCEVKIGSTWYVFDSNFYNETGRNGYQISYGQSGTWQYVKYGYIH